MSENGSSWTSNFLEELRRKLVETPHILINNIS